MTIAEAARRLEVSPSLVYSLVAAGKLRYCWIGHGRERLRIPEDAIGEYLGRCMFGVRQEEPVAAAPRLKHLRLS